MHPELRIFCSQWLGVVVSALLPVIFTAFVSMPMSLGRHPGEPPQPGAVPSLHMT